MTITREMILDLMPGDVVRVVGPTDHPPAEVSGVVFKGPRGNPYLGPVPLLEPSGALNPLLTGATMEIISSVERPNDPFYANHPRPGPATGDVVRDADGTVWTRESGVGGVDHYWWNARARSVSYGGPEIVMPLTLLVDGESGEVVASP